MKYFGFIILTRSVPHCFVYKNGNEWQRIIFYNVVYYPVITVKFLIFFPFHGWHFHKFLVIMHMHIFWKLFFQNFFSKIDDAQLLLPPAIYYMSKISTNFAYKALYTTMPIFMVEALNKI